MLGRFIYSFEYLRYNKCLLGLGADLGVIDNGVDESAGFKLGGVAGRALKECGSAGFKVRGLDALAAVFDIVQMKSAAHIRAPPCRRKDM